LRLLSAVSSPEQPEAFGARTESLLRVPTATALQHYMELVTAFTDWGLGDAQLVSRYMELDEWGWLYGQAISRSANSGTRSAVFA